RDFKWNVVTVLPDVAHWEHDVFRKCARAIDADTVCIGAKMSASCETVTAAAADNVAFAANQFAGMKVVHVGADLHDLADELVSDDQGHRNSGAGPLVPRVDVQVGAADSGGQDADFDVINTDVRLRHILEPEATLTAGFYERLHAVRVERGLIRISEAAKLWAMPT